MIKDLMPKLPITRRVGVGRAPNTPGNATNAPVKLDFFEVTKDFQGNAFVVDEDARKLLGEKPRRIPIRFLSDILEDNLHINHQLWAGPTLMCEGDGEGAMRKRFLDRRVMDVVACRAQAQRTMPGGKTVGWPTRKPDEALEWKKRMLAGATAEIAKNRVEYLKYVVPRDNAQDPMQCQFAADGHCKVVSQLVFQIVGLNGLARYRSHGVHTAQELMGSLMLLMGITNGVIRDIPLVLVVKWGRITTPDGKSVGAPIVHVEASDALALGEQAAALMAQRKNMELQIAEDRKLLQAAHQDVSPTAIAREFQEPGAAVAEVLEDNKPSGGIEP